MCIKRVPYAGPMPLMLLHGLGIWVNENQEMLGNPSAFASKSVTWDYRFLESALILDKILRYLFASDDVGELKMFW